MNPIEFHLHNKKYTLFEVPLSVERVATKLEHHPQQKLAVEFVRWC